MRLFFVSTLLAFVTNCLAITINVSGTTEFQGMVELPEKARINQLYEKVQIDENSFFLGAQWLRKSAKTEQTALKNGLIFDLTVLRNTTALHQQTSFTNTIDNLLQFIKALSITGRIPHVLDPAAVLGTRINHQLEDGDNIIFPHAPQNIMVIGATDNICTTVFSPMKNAAYYLQKCQPNTLADKNRVWIIQANGSIINQGVAPWNRKNQSFIAPGAIIFIPLKEQLLENINTTLNEEIADFLATQTPMENLP